MLAHELSHIGNGDTDLGNLVAALVATTRLPFATVKAFLDSAIDAGAAGSLIGVCGLLAVVLFAVFVVSSTLWSRHGDGMALTSLPNYLDSRALKCHNFVEFTVSNFVNPLQAL